MSNQPPRGSRLSALLVAVVSLLAGAGLAAVAVNAVISASAPNDSSAVQSGPEQLVDPGRLIQYGG